MAHHLLWIRIRILLRIKIHFSLIADSLTSGENIISVSAIDQNGSRTDKIVKVIYDQSKNTNKPSVEIKIEYPLPNQKRNRRKYPRHW